MGSKTFGLLSLFTSQETFPVFHNFPHSFHYASWLMKGNNLPQCVGGSWHDQRFEMLWSWTSQATVDNFYLMNIPRNGSVLIPAAWSVQKFNCSMCNVPTGEFWTEPATTKWCWRPPVCVHGWWLLVSIFVDAVMTVVARHICFPLLFSGGENWCQQATHTTHFTWFLQISKFFWTLHHRYENSSAKVNFPPNDKGPFLHWHAVSLSATLGASNRCGALQNVSKII